MHDVCQYNNTPDLRPVRAWRTPGCGDIRQNMAYAASAGCYPDDMTLTRRDVLATPLVLAASSAFGRDRDVPFVATPDELVEAMLDLADVKAGDRLIDLGSGDGRIPMAAARRGATALGIEIDPQLVARARRRAENAGLSGQATFRNEDLFTTPLREATVVTLYLLSAINLRLRPRLLFELNAGTRVVSHAFDMGDWTWDGHVTIDDRQAYLWIIPAVAGGEWLLNEAGTTRRLSIEQRYQKITGTLDGVALTDARLRGTALSFAAGGRRYAGQVGDAAIEGDGWRAERAA